MSGWSEVDIGNKRIEIFLDEFYSCDLIIYDNTYVVRDPNHHLNKITYEAGDDPIKMISALHEFTKDQLVDIFIKFIDNGGK